MEAQEQPQTERRDTQKVRHITIVLGGEEPPSPAWAVCGAKFHPEGVVIDGMTELPSNICPMCVLELEDDFPQ